MTLPSTQVLKDRTNGDITPEMKNTTRTELKVVLHRREASQPEEKTEENWDGDGEEEGYCQHGRQKTGKSCDQRISTLPSSRVSTEINGKSGEMKKARYSVRESGKSSLTENLMHKPSTSVNLSHFGLASKESWTEKHVLAKSEIRWRSWTSSGSQKLHPQRPMTCPAFHAFSFHQKCNLIT